MASIGAITSANAVYTLTITDLFNSPQQLQGFSADDIFNTETLKSAEVVMGLDGTLSGGFVYVPIVQSVTLQADSASNAVFDQWWTQSQSSLNPFIATGYVSLPSLGTKWNMTRGFLTGYMPIPDAKKLLQPRKFEITWNTIQPAST